MFQIEETNTFTLNTGLANVGGQAGLWLGVNVMTVIQTLYYTVVFVLSKCNKIFTV